MHAQDRLTPELLDALLSEVRRGVPAYRAAQARGIAKSTFYEWLRWGKEGRAPYLTLVERLKRVDALASTPAHPAQARGPFVGREREIARLHSAIEMACGGRAQLILIAGEPGIGKTRLTEELALRAADRMSVLVARCFEGTGAPPFWPWVQILRAYAHARDASALRAEMGTWAPDIAQIVPELHDRVSGLPPAPALDPAHARFRVFEGVTSLLAAAARHQPLMLVLDDIHWADRPSLLLLEFLARAMQDTRLLIMATYRDAEVHAGDALLPALAELAREPVCERIVLEGLTPPDVTRFIELHAGQRPSAALAATVYERSEGNPFFITELVRLLVDDDGGRRAGDGAAWQVTIPQGVRAVIARRLNRLSEECNRVLVLAAAFGREFALDPLMRVSDVAGERVLDALDEALRAGIIAEVASRERYSFSHALVRDSLYEELGAIRRTRLHRRIAEALIAVHSPHLETHFDELAHHFFQAALGGEGAEEAISHAIRAAEHALSRLAYEKASEHYELALRALALAPADERRRGHLLLALGDAFARACDVERTKATFQQAAAIARRLDDMDMLARAALGFCGIVVGVGTVDDAAVALLEESLAGLDERDSSLRARLLAQLASELYFAPDAWRRDKISQQAVDMARRLNDPTALISALQSRHFSIWGMADPVERLALAAEIVRLAEELNDRELLLSGHQFRITDLLEIGDIAALDAAIACYEGLADELRQPTYWWRVKTFQAMRALMIGRFADAEACALAAVELGQRVQPQTAINFFSVQLFSLRREQGRLADLESSVRALVDAYAAVPSWRSALANLYAELGRRDEARAEFERLAARNFADLPHDNSRLTGLTLLAEVCAFLDDRDRAAILYDKLLPAAAYNVVAGTAAACNGSVARPLGLLAATMRRWDDAAAHFESALYRNRAVGALPFIVRTEIDYAAMLLARGGDLPASAKQGAVKARELLADAQQNAVALGMTTMQARAAQLLRELETDPAPQRGRAPRTRLHRAADPCVQAANIFRLDGEVWMLAFAGELCRLEDARGLRYIAALLRRPHVELHALDLVQQVAGTDASAAAPRVPQNAGARLDAASRRAYRDRLTQLREELQRSRTAGPGTAAARDRIATLEREIEFLTRELAAGVGLAGHARLAASSSERARISVTRAIKLAVGKIGARHPPLAAHLTKCLRTGTYCCYDPPRDVDIEWRC